MNAIKKYTLWLLLGLVVTSSFVYEAYSYKKTHQEKILGLYQVHKYTISLSPGASGEDDTIYITVSDDNLLFDPLCYRGADCKLDLSNQKITYGDVTVVGSMEKTWSGFTSNYTVFEKINNQNYSWTYQADWKKIKD